MFQSQHCAPQINIVGMADEGRHHHVRLRLRCMEPHSSTDCKLQHKVATVVMQHCRAGGCSTSLDHAQRDLDYRCHRLCAVHLQLNKIRTADCWAWHHVRLGLHCTELHGNMACQKAAEALTQCCRAARGSTSPVFAKSDLDCKRRADPCRAGPTSTR